jgi:NAD(P)-dependent dehydrogenase (short-subunit alcohol dehydrogenase family)
VVLGGFGRIDTLLNVARVNHRMPAENLTEADYDFILDVNLKGPFLLSLRSASTGSPCRKYGTPWTRSSTANDPDDLDTAASPRFSAQRAPRLSTR